VTVLTPVQSGRMMPLVAAPRDPAWKETTLGPVVQQYLAYLRGRRVTKLTLKNKEAVLSRMCTRLDGFSLPDLSGKQGRVVLEETMVRDEWADIQPNSLDTYLSTLKAFFAWAYDEELLLHDPARRIDRPKQREREYSLFTPEEHASLIQAQPFERDRVAIMLIFEFALRSNDIRLLQLGDIQLDRQAVRFKHGKGGTDRTLSFRTGSVFEAVNQYLTLDRRGHPDEFLLYPQRCFIRGSYEHGKATSSLPRNGEPFQEAREDGRCVEYMPGDRQACFGTSGLRAWWVRCLGRAGLEWRPFQRRIHDARHTTGTRLVGDGKNFRTVSKFLRHSNLNTTELYVHLNELESMRDELWSDS